MQVARRHANRDSFAGTTRHEARIATSNSSFSNRSTLGPRRMTTNDLEFVGALGASARRSESSARLGRHFWRWVGICVLSTAACSPPSQQLRMALAKGCDTHAKCASLVERSEVQLSECRSSADRNCIEEEDNARSAKELLADADRPIHARGPEVPDGSIPFDPADASFCRDRCSAGTESCFTRERRLEQERADHLLTADCADIEPIVRTCREVQAACAKKCRSEKNRFSKPVEGASLLRSCSSPAERNWRSCCSTWHDSLENCRLDKCPCRREDAWCPLPSLPTSEPPLATPPFPSSMDGGS